MRFFILFGVGMRIPGATLLILGFVLCFAIDDWEFVGLIPMGMAHIPNHRREEGISSRVGASRIVRADGQTDSASIAESIAHSGHSGVEFRGVAVARQTKSKLEASMKCRARGKDRMGRLSYD